MTDKPLFSIIVVSYNAGSKIKDTINSVLVQTYNKYEIVVKDALSIDGTVSQIPSDERIRIFETKDGGIYDGMNQAIDYARGDLLFFLNCGDVFKDKDVLRRIADFYEDNGRKCEFIYGGIFRGNRAFELPSKITNFFMYHGMIYHQAVFFHKSLFDKYGKYDLSYKLAADYEYMVRMFKAGVRMDKTETIICQYEGGGASETESGTKQGYYERKRIIKKYYSFPERIGYGLIMFFSLRKVRIFLASDNSPKFINRFYHWMRAKFIKSNS